MIVDSFYIINIFIVRSFITLPRNSTYCRPSTQRNVLQYNVVLLGRMLLYAWTAFSPVFSVWYSVVGSHILQFIRSLGISEYTNNMSLTLRDLTSRRECNIKVLSM